MLPHHPPLLRGERIRLTALQDTDAHSIAQWYEDEYFVRHFDASPSYPRDADYWRKWLHDVRNDKHTYAFAIRPLTDHTLIGLVDVSDIYWTNRNGILGMGIGNSAYRHKGIGTEAMQLMLRFCFRELNLHRLSLTVFSYNLPAIRLYERLGFVKEGVYRQQILRDGVRYDMLAYGLLIHEWQALQPPRPLNE